jgi:hypothetical protein
MINLRVLVVSCVCLCGCAARNSPDDSASLLDAGAADAADSALAIDDGSGNACGGTEQLYHLVNTDCEAHGSQWSADHFGAMERAPDCVAPGTWTCDGVDSVVCQTQGNGDGEVCDGVDNDCDGKIDEGEDGKSAGACSFGF